jgi:cytochrome c
MKRLVTAAASAVSVAVSFYVQASDELAKKHACFACHTTDKKMVGPSYKDVAAKYRNDKEALAKLAQKVKNGSQGVWGNVPMPPNTAVPDGDINALVKWILAQK